MGSKDPPPKKAAMKPATKSARAGLKFLIVDGDEYYANQLKRLILRASGQGEGVHVVSTVVDALKSLNAHNYDVCFLDFALADQVGLQTDEIARLSKLLTATIFVADKPSKESALRALNVGAKDFLIKSNVSDFDVAKSISYALYWKYREIEMEALAVREHVSELDQVPLFDEHLRHAMEVAKRGKEKVGLLMIGLSGMEPVLEDYGEEVSEALLKQVGERISSKVRATDVVAKLNNKEFGAVLVKVASPAVVETISGTITGALSDKPYNINGYALKIGATVGASTFPDTAENLDGLKKQAKKSMETKKSKKEEKVVRSSFDYY